MVRPLPVDTGLLVGSRGRARLWRIDRPIAPATGTVVLVHGLGEHMGRYDHVASCLSAHGLTVHRFDLAGHGRSSGRRGWLRLRDAVEDIDRLLNHHGQPRVDGPLFIVGHSLGGAIAVRFAVQYPRRVAGLALSGPLIALPIGPGRRLVWRMLAIVAPGVSVEEIDPTALVRAPEARAAIAADPLMMRRGIPAFTGGQIVRHAAQLRRLAGQIETPVLIQHGSLDPICSPSAVEWFSGALHSHVTVRRYDGLAHEIFNEPGRDRVLTDLCQWISARGRVAPGQP